MNSKTGQFENGTWFAALVKIAPHSPDPLFRKGRWLELAVSRDEGRTWQNRGPLTLTNQKPGHILELQSGELLLSYGTRIPGMFGVALRLSTDGGETWSLPNPLIHIVHKTDCGYPCSVQLQDGTIVTAYYFGPKVGPHSPGFLSGPSALPWHYRYHMGVARWHIEDLCAELKKNEG